MNVFERLLASDTGVAVTVIGVIASGMALRACIERVAKLIERRAQSSRGEG